MFTPEATTGPGLAERVGAPNAPEREGGSYVTAGSQPMYSMYSVLSKGSPETTFHSLQPGGGAPEVGSAPALTCHHQGQEVTPL